MGQTRVALSVREGKEGLFGFWLCGVLGLVKQATVALGY